jgi:hypothetical protein
MKRYYEEHNGPSNMVEHPDGDWVKWEDANAALEEAHVLLSRISKAMYMPMGEARDREEYDALHAISDYLVLPRAS